MIARRLSLALSVAATCLLALACHLGYQQSESSREPDAVMGGVRPDVPQRQPSREPILQCERLDQQIVECGDAIERAWSVAVPQHYPEKVRQLIAIKRRDALKEDAVRACRGGPRDPILDPALTACLSQATCSDFARCVAENSDD